MTVRWIAVLSVVMASTAVRATQVPIKDAEGTTVGVVAVCNDCRSSEGKSCASGAEEGWLDGQPCGKCLLESNYNSLLKHPYDLQITGTLTHPDGTPVKDRYVKAFLPGGWSVRSRTSEEGAFRLMLGATAERKSKQPVLTDLGTHIDTQVGTDPYYAIFLLPDAYKPCAKGAMASPKSAGKGTPKTKKK